MYVNYSTDLRLLLGHPVFILDGNYILNYTYIKSSCACKEQSLLLDLFKAFDGSKAVKSFRYFFSLGKYIFSFMRAQHVLSHHLI